MLEIMPLQTREERLYAAEATGAQFLEDTLAYAAFSDGKAVALCQFKITEDGGEIHSINVTDGYGDFTLPDLLCRATLSFIELCGEEYAFYIPASKDDELIRSLGFEKDASGKLSLKLR